MAKDSQLVIRISTEQKATLKSKAQADGRSMSEYIINKLKLGAK